MESWCWLSGLSKCSFQRFIISELFESNLPFSSLTDLPVGICDSPLIVFTSWYIFLVSDLEAPSSMSSIIFSHYWFLSFLADWWHFLLRRLNSSDFLSDIWFCAQPAELCVLISIFLDSPLWCPTVASAASWIVLRMVLIIQTLGLLVGRLHFESLKRLDIFKRNAYRMLGSSKQLVSNLGRSIESLNIMEPSLLPIHDR